MPGHDQAIKLQYPRLEHLQLGAKRRNTGTCDIGQPFVIAITGDLEQLFNTSASDRGNDTELGKVSSDCVDDGRLLTNEQMACAMEHQAALLLGRLRRDEPHVCPGHRFADCFRVGRIVLLPLDVGFYVSRRHKAHRMPKRLQFARPIMRGGAGFDTDQAGRQFLEECQNVATLQLTPDYHLALRINAVDLKNRFGNVETDCRDRLHDWLLQIVGPLTAPTSMALACRWRSRPQHQNRTNAVQQRHIFKFVLVASRNRTGGNITGVSFFKKKLVASTKQFPMQERRTRNAVKLEGAHLKVLSVIGLVPEPEEPGYVEAPDRGVAEFAAKKKPWAISRANTYRGAALPKGANTGGATLGGRSHARTRTDHNQRANSFGPNELRAIATSGDTMPFVWDFQL